MREVCPAFFCFDEGGEEEFRLSREEQRTAPFEDRLKSIWRFLVRETMKFAQGLKPRELANFSHEDMVQEFALVLREKDRYFDVDRGLYITFAGKIIERHKRQIFERARVVQTPRNSGSRINALREMEAAEGLSERRRDTYAKILATTHTPSSWDEAHEVPDLRDPPEELDRQERERRRRDFLRRLGRRLPPEQARALAAGGGLLGAPGLTRPDLARLGRQILAELAVDLDDFLGVA